MMDELWQLPLGLQVSLGAGYLAYTTAYAGMRRDHAARDAVFISLAFSSVALLVFSYAVDLVGDAWSCVAALSTALLTGAIWRTVGRPSWQWLMSACGVHREDGLFHGWDAIVQTKRRVGQATVHTKSGRVLHLLNRPEYRSAPWEGLYLGGDGSVTMIVEEEDLPDGQERKRETIRDSEWGDRMTHIPADQIERVEIRMK